MALSYGKKNGKFYPAPFYSISSFARARAAAIVTAQNDSLSSRSTSWSFWLDSGFWLLEANESPMDRVLLLVSHVESCM